MPYEIRKSDGGYKVHSPGGPHSKKKMTLRNAKAQLRLLNAVKHGWSPDKNKGG